MNLSAWSSRDRAVVVAGLALPLAVAVALVPFRSGFPNTDAALALVGGIVYLYAGKTH